MKQLSILLYFTFLLLQSYAQAVISRPAISKSITKDFGAIGDGKHDDTWAFIKAGKFFSNLWDINGRPLPPGKSNFSYLQYSGELLIPSGTYLVGKQINVTCSSTPSQSTYGAQFGDIKGTAPINFYPGQAYKYGLELIKLENKIDQLVIKKGSGSTRPVIKYADKLVIGYFDCSGIPKIFRDPADNSYDGKYGVGIGGFIEAKGCKNIVVENIEINGNNTKAVYGGGWTQGLIQTGASGLLFIDVKNVTVRNMYIHHMTLDGVMFDDYYLNPATKPIQSHSNFLMSNTVCDYNRRQGFSWVGGRGITVTDCKFNNTSMAQTSGAGRGNPGAGLDIEPERSDNGSQLFCMDGKFINCEFINNLGLAMVNDVSGIYAENISFTNSKFADADSYALMVTGKKFTFNECKIWGGLFKGNAGEPGDETVFNHCNFSDSEYIKRPALATVRALVESDGFAKRMRFSDCTFSTSHKNQRMFVLRTAGTTEADFNIFSGCRFTMQATSSQHPEVPDYLIGCRFDGNNYFINKNPNAFQRIFTNGLVFAGSTDAARPYNFTTEGKLMLTYAYSNGTFTQFMLGRKGNTKTSDGFFNYNIGPGSSLYPYWGVKIDIGKNAKLVNKPGGQLTTLSGAFNNSGKIILDAGSYTAFLNDFAINTIPSGNEEFYYDKKAIIGVHKTWVPVYGNGGWFPLQNMTRTPNTFFTGDNTAIPTAARKKKG